MTNIYSLQKLSFLFLARLIFAYYKWMLVTVILLTSIPFLIAPSVTMAKIIFQFDVLFFAGLLLSYIVHEYLHIRCLKRNRLAGEIEVKLSRVKISLYPQFELSKREMIKVALLPALLLPVVGLVLVSIGTLTQQTFLTLTGCIYIIHVINIIPPLGDGVMLIKALL